MRRLLSAFAALALGASALAGCASQPTPSAARPGSPADDGTVKVVTTIFPPYDFARAVCGDKAEVSILLSPGAEAHTFEPTPQDIMDIQSSDLFIYVGGENDEWVEDLLATMDEAPRTLRLVDCVDVVEEELVEGMEDDEHDHEGDADGHDHDADEPHDHEAEIDEHVWTSPRNAVAIVDQIASSMGEVDPANAAAYERNAHALDADLEELDGEFRAVVSSAKRTTIVFGDRFPLRYLADEYGLDYYAAFPGCSEENEASAKTVAFLIDKVEELDVPVVFSIELSNGKIADAIAEATGAERLTFHSCHNVTAEQMEQGVTYVDLMRENVESLRVALG